MPKARILLVEDERLIAHSLRLELERLGYAVPEIAASGEEAVEKAQRVQPDVVLMDIVLRGVLDGIDAAKRILTQRTVPIIYATAFADEETLQRARETRPIGCLLKPIAREELQAAIEEALQSRDEPSAVTAA